MLNFFKKIYFRFFPRKVVKEIEVLDPADDIRKYRKIKKWARVYRDQFSKVPEVNELKAFGLQHGFEILTKGVRPDRCVLLHKTDGVVVKIFGVTKVRRELPQIVKERISPVIIIRNGGKESTMLAVQYAADELGEEWASNQMKREIGHVIPKVDINKNNAGYFNGKAVLIDW